MQLLATIRTIDPPRRTIPLAISHGGYVKVPEWLFYYLGPNSLSLIREIRKTLKTVGRYRYSDITNRQLSERCGLSISYVDRLMNRLADRGYLKRRFHYESKTVRRRKIYSSSLKALMSKRTNGVSFREMLEQRAFRKCKRIEWARINASDWLEWIPAPNLIKDPYCLKVFGVLIGQYLRGTVDILLSNRQLALICKMDREKVAESIEALEVHGLITVEAANLRRRTIRFSEMEMAGLVA